MKYMLLSYLEEKAWADLGEAEQQRIMAEATPHAQRLLAEGKFLGGAARQTPKTATTGSRGGWLVTDGPFAETREQLGGYVLIEVEDLDEAIRSASGFLGRCPSRIEIRPVMQIEGVPAYVEADLRVAAER